MFHHLRNKKIAAIGAICLLAAAGGAYAFWTAAGTGSATGTASSGGTITLVGTIASGIAPGLSKAVTFTATNPTTSEITVGTVSLVSVATDKTGCVVDDFTMPAVPQNQAIAATNLPIALDDAGSLTMANTGINQDLCKGAVITLTLSST